MLEVYVGSFASPDEVIEVEGVRSDMVELGGVTLARDIHQPGWRWSTHLRPLVGTEWCETRHVGYAMRGRLHIITKDGLEYDIGAGNVFDLPPGHDAWVVGDETFEMLSWMGARTWLASLQSLKERVLVTLVFTDIVDSTGAARRLGDRVWADLVASHNQRLADVADRFRGQVAKLTGDGMLAIFDGAVRAIRFAMASDKAVADLGIEIRAAVHTGEIEVAGEEIHGLAVHEASRILELAAAGEIFVSATTAGLAREADLDFQDRGVHELRGVGDQVQLFTVDDRT